MDHHSSIRGGGSPLPPLVFGLQARDFGETVSESEGFWNWLREFANACPDATLLIDSTGRIVSLNSHAENLFGYSARDLIGSPIQRILPGVRTLTPEPPPAGAHVEVEGSRGDASFFQARVSLTPIGPAYVALIQDVTDQRRIERERSELISSERMVRDEVERANKIKDDFLATLSHELRTPLTAMLGWTQILRNHETDSELSVRALETIERNIQIQTRLIEDLLDLSSIASGTLRLDIHPVRLPSIIDAALEMVGPDAEAKRITVARDFEPGAPAVLGDARRLQQVMWNLLSNAVKFTPDGGAITVSLRRLGSFARIDVTDSGQGIESSLLPFVFDRFRQSDSSTRRHHSGLGLGLSIVKSVVEMHGGAARAESAGPGAGATFIVLIPQTSLLNGGLGESPHDESSSPFSSGVSVDVIDRIRGVRVLVVDDERDTRESFRRILEDYGAIAFVAGSAAEALAAIARHHPDVMLCDIGMPGEDGYQLIQNVRALGRRQDREIPAAALTAFSSSQDQARAIEGGFQIHVPKPLEPARLAGVVARLAAKRTE